MKLYLVQHGEAVREIVDPERPLSKRGRKDVQAVAAFIKRSGVRVAAIQHSGKARAAETAEILAAAVGPANVTVRPGLAPDDPVATFVADVRQPTNDLLVVGHLPFLAKAVAALVCGDESKLVVLFQQGGLVCLSQEMDSRWSVAWMVVPSVLSGEHA